MPRITAGVTTVGANGAAIGTANTPPVWGRIKSIGVDYQATCPNTTTVDVDEVGGAARKILDKAASNTDVTHYPSEQREDNTGSAVAGAYRDFYVDGRPLLVTVDLSNALAPAVILTIEVDGYVGVQ